MATQVTQLIIDEQRRALIFELLSQQCKTSRWDNACIIDKIREAALFPILTSDDVCRAIYDFQQRQLVDEIDEIYWSNFWLGGNGAEAAMWTSSLY